MPLGKSVHAKGKNKHPNHQQPPQQHQQRHTPSSAAHSHAPTNEELASLQATEMEVLASIFGQDLKRVQGDAQSPWAKSATSGHQFEILLRPDVDDLKQYVAASVRFRLPIRYPLLPAIVTVLLPGADNGTIGLSTDHVKTLETHLARKAKELAGGGEMIWEIVTFGQEWISLNNLHLKKKEEGPNISLEEEKALREKEKEQARQIQAQQESVERNEEEAKRTSKIADLIQQQADQQTAAFEEERQKLLRFVRSPSSQDIDPRSPAVQNEISVSGNARWTETFLDAIEEGATRTHTVSVGPLIKDNGIFRTYIAEAASSASTDAASWFMDIYPIDELHYSLSSGKRKLQEIEWELDKLRMLRAETLVNVLASALINQDDSAKRLVIVTESLKGPSLRVILSHCITLPWSRARCYLLDVLCALDALHTKNLLHRDVKLDNIHLDSEVTSTKEVPGAKLAHAGYQRRLQDLDRDHPLTRSSGAFAADDLPGGWEAPELALVASSERGNSHYTRKRDVWQTGVVTLQMLFGADVISRYSTVDAFLNSNDSMLEEIAPHVLLLLKATLEKSTRKRPSAAEIRSRLEDIIRYEDEEDKEGSKTLQVSIKDEEDKNGIAQTRRRLTRGISEQEGLQILRPGSFWQNDRNVNMPSSGAGNFSRYESDFEEIELLGKGAYGAVYRARNRLDGRDYAIKKVRLSPTAVNDERTLREISALSRLSHQHIVRYVTCWIQIQDDARESATSSSGEALTTSRSMQMSARDFILPGLDDFLSVGHDAFSSAGQNVRFAHSDSESSDDDDSSDEENDKQENGAKAISPTLKEKSVSDGESDESDGTTEASSKKIMSSKKGSKRQEQSAPTSPRWLFIQMEYVQNQTLREAIDRGLSLDECWRLFRQMIEALAHVASLGIIHRDLKPSNILMYGGGINDEGEYLAGDIKIGDFGLATTTPQSQSLQHQQVQQQQESHYGSLEESADLTSEIGTNLYIAPEVDKPGSRYDHKVDVYAAGVVFFEMLASQRIYKTGMERISVLRDLRKAEVHFPNGWNEGQWQAQSKIIRSLLQHNPSDRPSPLELLKSELLPPKMEDEYIAECMRLLSAPNSTYNLQLMDSLFNRKEGFEEREARDFTFDAGSNVEEGQGMDNRFIGVASHLLRGIFHRRGAVELDAPLLIPPNELYKEEQKPVEFIDKTGKVVQLPYDLVVPFARMVARGEQQRFKRYSIAPVYRNNVLAGGQPRSVVEVDYDIVAPEKTAAAEAEVLSVVDEILEEMPGFESSDWVIQISHSHILNLLLERVPLQHRGEALKAIGSLSSGSKSAASDMRFRLNNLGLGIPRSVVDEIEMANVSDDIDVVREKLQRFLALDLRPRLARAVEEIQSVVEMAKHFGVARRFLLTPLLVTNQSFYKDNVFFVVVRMRGKRRDVLASGGRYDALIKRFTNPTLIRPPAHAVGIQVGLGRIALALAKHQDLLASSSHTASERNVTPFTPTRCDVYVASAPHLLSLRMEICKELWAANISADLAYEHALQENTPESLASTCRAEGILFLVIARARYSSVVKVKCIYERSEYEVNRWELATWLSDRIGKLRGGSGINLDLASGSSGPNDRSHAATMNAPVFNPIDAEVILPERYTTDKRKIDKHGSNDRRMKKQLAPIQENSIRQVSKAIEEVSSATSHSSKIPIIAVDIATLFAFQRLCAASIARDDEALWKLFMESMSSTPEEREYARSIRRRIDELEEGAKAWLVSIRQEGKCTLV